MTFLIAASELDLSEPSVLEKLKPLQPILDRCWMVPVHAPRLKWRKKIPHEINITSCFIS